MNNETLERANKIVQVAIERFTSDRVDYTIEEEDILEIIIHFPEVIIESDNELRMPRKDLYVMVKIDMEVEDGDVYFMVFASSFTDTQLYHKSIHPHVSIDGYPCLGDGRIKDAMDNLSTEDIDPVSWLVYFNCIEEFLCTESTEGGPYTSIETLLSYNKEDQIEVFKAHMKSFANTSYRSKELEVIAGMVAMSVLEKEDITFSTNGDIVYMNGYEDHHIMMFTKHLLMLMRDKPEYLESIKKKLFQELISDSDYICSEGRIKKVSYSRSMTPGSSRYKAALLWAKSANNITFKGKPVEIKILVDSHEVEYLKLITIELYTTIKDIINKYASQSISHLPDSQFTI